MGRLLLLIPMLFIGGCAGYTIGSVQPTYMKGIKRIAVPVFINRTVEPDIEVLVTSAMISKLQQDGTYEVTSVDQADAEIKGSIQEIRRSRARSVIGNVLASQEFTIALIVHLDVISHRTGGIIGSRDIEGDSSYFVGTDVATQERQAIPLAAEDAATQATSYLSEGW